MEEGKISVSATENRIWSASPESETDKHGDARRRKKHRRGRKRKSRPYEVLTQEERRELELRQAARAARKEAGTVGRADAPWNTTQFIMEDRGQQCEFRILSAPRGSRTVSVDSGSLSEDDMYESPEEEQTEQEHVLEQDFENMYHQIATERLQGLSKDELVREYLDLENEMETAQSQMRRECTSKISQLEEELVTLREQNSKLVEENEELKSHVVVKCQ